MRAPCGSWRPAPPERRGRFRFRSEHRTLPILIAQRARDFDFDFDSDPNTEHRPMADFLDSTPYREDAGELRRRSARDGHLFFAGLLPREPLLKVRRQILAICERHGFLAPGSDPAEAIAAPGVRWREGDPEYMAAYDEIQRLELFHALAHESSLLEVLERFYGEAVLAHPRNIARVMFPQNNRFATPAHQDFVHIQGCAETYTAWIPLGDCPRQLGGVEVLPGSHRHGVLPPH